MLREEWENMLQEAIWIWLQESSSPFLVFIVYNPGSCLPLTFNQGVWTNLLIECYYRLNPKVSGQYNFHCQMLTWCLPPQLPLPDFQGAWKRLWRKYSDRSHYTLWLASIPLTIFSNNSWVLLVWERIIKLI